MARELKQDRALASLDEARRSSRRSAPPGRPSRDVADRPRADGDRAWFDALDPAAAPPPVRPSALAAAPLLLAAVVVVAFIKSTAVRTLLPLVLVLAAGWVLYRAHRGALPPRRRLSRWRGLEMGGERLAFRAGGAPQVLLDLAAPFGVTLLATPRRDRMVALLSSAAGTFYVGAAFDAPSRRAFAPLLDRATTVVTDDASLDAIGPDGESLYLAPDELASLLDALVELSPSCLDRFVLTDARGAELSLDARLLSAGERKVDLTAPLEWKPIVFQEPFGHAVAVYQGTWIRQGGTELVLVCLLPSLGPVVGADLDIAALDRSALRDLRLMQASPEQPPPTDQRVAIERLFMLPLRSALDRAPRPSQQPTRARA